MVPADFANFFLGAAGVAGALIGLLFVAVSVKPDAVRRGAPVTERLRPVAAFSALLDSLVVSLIALIPGSGLGPTSVAVAAHVGVHRGRITRGCSRRSQRRCVRSRPAGPVK